MTTGQILVLLTASLAILISIAFSMKQKNIFIITIAFIATFSLLILNVIIISYVKKANKKPILPKEIKYEPIVLPTDTLYRIVK